MKFIVEIGLGNEAMETPADVIDSIRKSIVTTKAGESAGGLYDPLAVGDEGVVRDGNGNNVGNWAVVA